MTQELQDRLLRAVKFLLTEIREMRSFDNDGKYWFDGFGEWRIDDEDDTAGVEWPNLRIAADDLAIALCAVTDEDAKTAETLAELDRLHKAREAE